MGTPLIAYFGYGSLVNAKTHRTSTKGLIPARLQGWKRGWSIRGEAPWGTVCALSVEPSENCAIDGVLVLDTLENLPDVDRREERYDRLVLDPEHLQTEEPLPDIPLYIYSAKPENRGFGDAEYPILQSYLDAVLQGYLSVFGEAGVGRFISETEGWHVPVRQDRDASFYPRAVSLTSFERGIVDQYLAMKAP